MLFKYVLSIYFPTERLHNGKVGYLGFWVLDKQSRTAATNKSCELHHFRTAEVERKWTD